MFHVESGDGAEIVVHRLGGDPDAPPLLISHATGFHARCYRAAAVRLAHRYRVVALDHRGHGLTPVPTGGGIDWREFGDDVVAVGRAVAPQGGLLGVGHSMGATTLLLAALAAPDLFDRLVLFEPITAPAAPGRSMKDHPLVNRALRRRRGFGSVEEAIDNFRGKPPLSEMTPDVLRDYVEFGFRPVIDDEGRPIGIELRCSPEVEAATFDASERSGLWERLGEVATPTTIVSGRVEPHQPSGRCAEIASLIPGARSIVLPHLGHLGPFSHPVEFAELVLDEADRSSP